MRFVNGRGWLFLVLIILAVSSFYLWQAGQNGRKAYAGGRIVERMEQEKMMKAA